MNAPRAARSSPTLRAMIRPALISLALAALTACSSPIAATPAASASTVVVTSSTPTPTSTVVIAKTYSTLADFRDDVIAAGYDCPNWHQTNQVKLAAASGSCSDNDVLSIYLSSADVSQVVQNLKELNASVHLLVGPNWVFNTSAPEMYRPKLGGIVVR